MELQNITEDYKQSDGELNNICYLTCKHTIGWMMREADFAVCKMMAEANKPIQGTEGIEHYLGVICEYVWDHICGEPDDVTPEAFEKHMTPMLEHWYANTTPEERANTN